MKSSSLFTGLALVALFLLLIAAAWGNMAAGFQGQINTLERASQASLGVLPSPTPILRWVMGCGILLGLFFAFAAAALRASNRED